METCFIAQWFLFSYKCHLCHPAVLWFIPVAPRISDPTTVGFRDANPAPKPPGCSTISSVVKTCKCCRETFDLNTFPAPGNKYSRERVQSVPLSGTNLPANSLHHALEILQWVFSMPAARLGSCFSRCCFLRKWVNAWWLERCGKKSLFVWCFG